MDDEISVYTTLLHKHTIINTPGGLRVTTRLREEKGNTYSMNIYVKLKEIICFNSFFILTIIYRRDVLFNICRKFQKMWLLA